MKGSIGEQVAHYLDAHREEILRSWLRTVISNQDVSELQIMHENGVHMLNLCIASAEGSAVDVSTLRDLAAKVAQERLKANVNIGEFVYNVNIARSQIFSHLPNLSVPIDELYPVFGQFNDLYDDFLYHAVHHYTELKNQQITEQSSFIEQSHKDKLTILGQMSASFVHEFRNPLTSVIGFVQLLAEKYPKLEYLDILTKELNELKFRITQFLLISKRGGDQHEKHWFRIGEVFHDTLDFLYPMIVGLNVEVVTEVDNSVCLFGYRDEFRQVLINIIMNSLDALSSSPVKLIRLKGYLENQHFVMSISNNGPPIPANMTEAIFEPFVSNKKLGTGIGLYLCKQIVTHHHGSIECHSDDLETTFRIEMPPETVSTVREA